jgi:hypothetical protein
MKPVARKSQVVKLLPKVVTKHDMFPKKTVSPIVPPKVSFPDPAKIKAMVESVVSKAIATNSDVKPRNEPEKP